jgi:hypothetical protein
VWKHFLNWGSLLSDGSSLCQVDTNPASTKKQHVAVTGQLCSARKPTELQHPLTYIYLKKTSPTWLGFQGPSLRLWLSCIVRMGGCTCLCQTPCWVLGVQPRAKHSFPQGQRHYELQQQVLPAAVARVFGVTWSLNREYLRREPCLWWRPNPSPFLSQKTLLQLGNMSVPGCEGILANVKWHLLPMFSTDTLPLFKKYLIYYLCTACVRGRIQCEQECVPCGGQRETFRTQLLPSSMGSRNWAHSIRPGTIRPAQQRLPPSDLHSKDFLHQTCTAKTSSIRPAQQRLLPSDLHRKDFHYQTCTAKTSTIRPAQ